MSLHPAFEAYLAELPFARIIHGKGTGKLRQAFNLCLPTWETGVERMLSEILAKEQR